MIQINTRNLSVYKKVYSPLILKKIAGRILEEEGLKGKNYELSLVFCDDDFIREMNKKYRKKGNPTDVLSFPIPSDFPGGEIQPLGEIIISLETVFNKYPHNPDAMKDEISLLFCHGLLHLLGYVHDTTQQRKQMIEKQANYLGIDKKLAWIKYPRQTNKKRE
ncbi:MAG TPA: rRNA maturation RNase YbeY [Candidatus Hydrogenedens sp.]|nr:rRNA maturation RNase YbeY [Candidatus Hydrogenedens sp.]